MVVTYDGRTYEFDYEFAPNDGTTRNFASCADGIELDGEIRLNLISPRRVSREVRALMWAAAVHEEDALQQDEYARVLRSRFSVVRRQPHRSKSG